MNFYKENRLWKTGCLILTGIWLVLLAWIFVTVLPGAGSQAALYWITAALVLAVLAAEIWMVRQSYVTAPSRALTAAGWTAAAGLWVFSSLLGLNLNALPIAGTAVESVRAFLSFYLTAAVFLPFWWTVRALMPASRQETGDPSVSRRQKG